MSISALVFVRTLGSDVPLWDEWWGIVPVITGHEPLTLRWLWSLHNDIHSIPLPRVLMLLYHELGSHDFRLGSYINVLFVVGTASALILTARRLRGYTSYFDAFFPLLLLHWGHWANYHWEWQITFISSMILSLLLLCIIVRSGNQLTRSSIILAGICLILLPLCGANGLLLVPFSVSWFLYLIAKQWRTQEFQERVNSILLGCFVLCSLFLTALIFWQSRYSINRIFILICNKLPLLCEANGLLLIPCLILLFFLYLVCKRWRSQVAQNKINSPWFWPSILIIFLGALVFWFVAHYLTDKPVSWTIFRVSLQFLTIGLGETASQLWPFSAPWVPVLFAISAVHLYRVWRRSSNDRPRVLGLFLFMAGVVATAIAVGAGRGGALYFAGLSPHYSVLAVPGLCCLYFMWEINSLFGKVAQASLCVAIGLLLPLNLASSLRVTTQLRDRIDLIKRDVTVGLPIFILEERHGYFLNPWANNTITVARSLEMLRTAGIGGFQNLRPDPRFRETTILSDLTSAEHMDQISETGVISWRSGDLTGRLRESQLVYAIRLKYFYGDPEKGPAFLQLSWKDSVRDSLAEGLGNVRIELQTGAGPERMLPDTIRIPRPLPTLEKTETIWINERMDQFRILPDDKPRLFHIKEITVLLPLKD